MTEASTGVANNKGWRAHKYYLSAEAQGLLEAHCKGTPLSMSAFLDMLIKKELTPKESTMVAFSRVVVDGEPQYVEHPVDTAPPNEDEARAQLRRERTAGDPPRTTRPKVDVREAVKNLPDKKDFKLDV